MLRCLVVVGTLQLHGCHQRRQCHGSAAAAASVTQLGQRHASVRHAHGQLAAIARLPRHVHRPHGQPLVVARLGRACVPAFVASSGQVRSSTFTTAVSFPAELSSISPRAAWRLETSHSMRALHAPLDTSRYTCVDRKSLCSDRRTVPSTRTDGAVGIVGHYLQRQRRRVGLVVHATPQQ